MIRVQKSRPTQRAESTVALINVVFLMLIFFLIAGTLAPTADRQVELVTLRDGVAAAPPDMLFIRSDGTLTWRGAPVGVDAVPALMASDKGDGDEPRPLRIAADRALAAARLVEVIAQLRVQGHGAIAVVTRQEAP